MCFEIDFQSRAVVPSSTVEMPKEGVSDVAIRGDARLWVAAGWDGRLRVHTLRKGIPLAVLKVRTPCLQENCGTNMRCSRRWGSHARFVSFVACSWLWTVAAYVSNWHPALERKILAPCLHNMQTRSEQVDTHKAVI